MPTPMIDTLGYSHDVPDELIAARAAQGWRPQVHSDVLQAANEAVNEREYGGAAGAVKAGLAGVARGATLGLSDLAARGLGGEDTAIELEGLRETNPGLSTATELGGALAPALFTGGGSLPAGAAASAGRGVAALAGGGIRGAIAGGAVEGAIFGAGQGVSDLALSADPLTVERIGSALSSNMLYGAALGAPIGGLGKAAELGLARAKGAIDGALERRALKAKTPAEAIESGDLELLDAKQLKAAREAELETIDKAQAPERAKLVDDLWDYRDRTYEAELHKTAHGVADGEIREAGGAFKRADKDLRNALDNKAALSRDPERLRGILERQEQALTKIHEWGTARRQEIDAELEGLTQKVRAEILARKVPGELGPFTPSGLELAVDREAQRQFEGLMTKSKGLEVIETKIPGAVDALQRFRQRIDDFAAGSTSPRLAKIDEALGVLAAPKEPSLGQAVLSAAAPFAGPLGVAAAAGQRALGSFQKVLGAAGERAGKATSAFLGAATPAVSAATPAVSAATPVATKVLASVRYAAAGKGETEAEAAHTLPALFKARTNEIKSQVHIAADGTFQMRPEARKAMAAKLDGIRVAHPILADQLETAGALRIAYLASIIPRRPDVAGAPMGPDIWQASDIAMRSWARSAAAVEDPHGVLERASHGAVTPEDVAAIKAVSPELLASFTNDVAIKLPELRKSLSPARKLALSYLTGVPVDPAMDPAILRVLQAQYQYEPETAGPRAQAQFGSVKNRAEVGTSSQRREEGSA